MGFLDSRNTFCYTQIMRTKVEELVIEWDDAKDAINFKKHHIHFSSAALVLT